MNRLPTILRGLCEDAAVFPPGQLPLSDAVTAHFGHKKTRYAGLVGPLVVPAHALEELRGLLPDGPSTGHRLPLAVTVPGPAPIGGVLDAVRRLPAVLRALEVAVPDGSTARDLLAELDAACAQAPATKVFVEVPRDERRPAVLSALSGTRYRAKFRTGGVKAELHPDEAELADAVAAAIAAGVPFKATAGLHHAIRNTDPATGFEQHGFLNLLLATDAALHGARPKELATLLAQRDPAVIVGQVAALDETRASAARSVFVSFGTCSITDPLMELIDLGLVPASLTSTIGEAV
ncbi:hypothetical protein [Streptomyces sp. YKOK-I1]